MIVRPGPTNTARDRTWLINTRAYKNQTKKILCIIIFFAATYRHGWSVTELGTFFVYGEPWDISKVVRDKQRVHINILGLGPQKKYSSHATL